MSNDNKLGPEFPKHFVVYDDFSSDIDLVAEGDGLGAARVIDIPSANQGDCSVQNLRGEPHTLPEFAGNKSHLGQFAKILASGTTITKCVVYW